MTLIVVVAADRGLCGGYNANLCAWRKNRRDVRVQRHRGEFFAVGRKALDHFKRPAPSSTASGSTTRRAWRQSAWPGDCQQSPAEWVSGAVSSSETAVIYKPFRSAISQRPTYEKVLPVETRREADRESAAPTDYLIEPSRAELVPLVMRSYLEATILHALLEAEASEHGARMTAMDAATNNAVDMIDRLTLEMNRARQANITRELMDIVGGAEALARLGPNN